MKGKEIGKVKESIEYLLKEPVSEDLEDASRNYADDEEYGDDIYFAIKGAFKAGAQWQKEKTIRKACEWLRTHRDDDFFEFIEDYNYCGAGTLNVKKMVEDLRKYLED